MVTPLLVLAIAFILGIVACDTLHISLTIAAVLLGFCLIMLLTVIKYKTEGLSALLAATLTFFFLGIFAGSVTAERLASGILYKAAGNTPYVTVEGSLNADPTFADGSARFTMRVTAARFNGVFDAGAYGAREWRVREQLAVKVRTNRALPFMVGDTVKVTGRLSLPRSSSDFDYRRYLCHKGIMATLSAAGEDIELVRKDNVQSTFMHYVGSLRQWIKKTNSGYLPEAYSSLLNGIVLGDASELGDDVQEAFRATGLTHVVAASGMNIALIVGALWPLLRRLRLRAPVQVIILIVFAGLYTIISGMSASINRAFVMAAIGLLAWLFGRQQSPLNSLAIAAFLLTVIDPFSVYDIGFQLSFLATASLVVLSPLLDRLFADVPSSIRSAFTVTVAAQIGVLPVLIYYFGQVSAVSILANLIVVPLAGPALILGMVVLPVAAILSLAGIPLYLLLQIILMAMIETASIMSMMPGAYVTLPPVSICLVFVLYAVIAASAMYIRRAKLYYRFSHIVLVVIGLLAVSLLWHLTLNRFPSGLEVTFLDVGQGDSILLTAPDGERALVDCGQNPKIIQRKLDIKGIKKVDALIISHAHADHMGGAQEFIAKHNIGSLMYPPSLRKAAICKPMFTTAKEKGVRCIPIRGDEALHLGKCLTIDMLCADTENEGNDESVVFIAKYRQFRVLFTGDASTEVEKKLLEGKDKLDVDVLKVGHHGSASSSSAEFLRRVAAKVAVIQVGQGNMYGHPSASAIKRLHNAGAKIYRTDKNGDVTIKSDGTTYRVLIQKGQ
ncbi:MAG TPA: DNA internalization-related competence protein ComEC/Rec2 [Candidatus Aquicultor sp.]|jgi:competence protein ComEC